MSRPFSAAIVGGGISGLTTAFWLKRSGIDVTVLEKELVPGGTMRSEHTDEWLVELGPNSALETTPLFQEIFDALGIAGEREYANDASNNRYILRSGTLHALPLSPSAFLKTRLWTLQGKLRLMKEPFVGRAEREESVAQFVERRLGREFLDYAINPFVAGVFAGNPEELSVRAAFPKLYALEEKYGGLIRGMIGGARERRQRAEKAKDRARMFSFRMGMQAFPDALASYLGEALHFGTTVDGLTSSADPETGRPQYLLRYSHRGAAGELRADAVVLSVPAYVARNLIAPFSNEAQTVLERITYPPVAEVFLGYRAQDIGRPLDGFGYLIPAVERRRILGTIWSSAIFSGRAPQGFAAFTTFVGGSRQPEELGNSDEHLVAMVQRELAELLQVTGNPVFVRVMRWEKAIPQYTLGHLQKMAIIDRLEADVPGLFVCSNYRGGIAVGDCVMSSRKIADRIIRLRNSEPSYLVR